MSITTQQKRLDEIETWLTPREWAIRLAGEARKYPNAVECLNALAERSFDDLPSRRPYLALEEQARHRHPGHKPEDSRARCRLTNALWDEFRGLQLLLLLVNERMRHAAERLALQAALRLSALHMLMLQDAFGRTAANAAAWIEGHRAKDADGTAHRQAVLNELAAWTDARLSETPADCWIDPGIRLCFPAPLAEWRQEMAALLKDCFAHRAAVEQIQQGHFAGHPILFPEHEADWAETTRTIETAVATFNEYLKSRREFAQGESESAEREGSLAIDLVSLKAAAKGRWAAAVAREWASEARREAKQPDAHRWEEWRQEMQEQR